MPESITQVTFGFRPNPPAFSFPPSILRQYFMQITGLWLPITTITHLTTDNNLFTLHYANPARAAGSRSRMQSSGSEICPASVWLINLLKNTSIIREHFAQWHLKCKSVGHGGLALDEIRRQFASSRPCCRWTNNQQQCCSYLWAR